MPLPLSALEGAPISSALSGQLTCYSSPLMSTLQSESPTPKKGEGETAGIVLKWPWKYSLYLEVRGDKDGSCGEMKDYIFNWPLFKLVFSSWNKHEKSKIKLCVAFHFCVYRRPLWSHASPTYGGKCSFPLAKGTLVTTPEKLMETIAVKT